MVRFRLFSLFVCFHSLVFVYFSFSSFFLCRFYLLIVLFYLKENLKFLFCSYKLIFVILSSFSFQPIRIHPGKPTAIQSLLHSFLSLP
jgi:hypothetical protein